MKSFKPGLSRSIETAAVSSRPDKERARLKQREQADNLQGLYRTKRWRDLRLKILERDLYTCRQTGVILSGIYPAPNSAVVDHIKPHRGDEILFWDIENLQSVAKSWHDSVKQAREKADQKAARYPDWLLPSAIPLRIVCGAPCAGKSSFVDTRKAPHDLVIDLDQIAAEISGEPLHGWAAHWLDAALWRRNEMLSDLSRASGSHAAWLIVSEPEARRREWWQEKLKPESLYVIETPESECIRRCKADSRPHEKTTIDAIVKWWWRYEARRGDIIINQDF